ncbi:MAG: hypothetical protein FJX59_14545 [Alphaproteobacteria bacterium]|nr:hypothetical protein [Alphaproteobacteria bacterium]
MKCLFKLITRKSRGGVSMKDARADSEIVAAGRGNDCQLHLPDPRVLLRHAEFTLRSDDIYLEPSPGSDVRLNGALTQMSKVAAGDKIRVGPYELILEAPTPEARLVMSVELVQPLGDDLQSFIGRSKTQVGAVGLSMRAWSWALALLVAVLTFGVPWVLSLFTEPPPVAILLNTREQRAPAAPTELWTSGGISSAHKFFGDSCEACHQTPFVPVQDGVCLSCHNGVQHHADPNLFPFASFADDSCQSCHKEHQGNRTVALSNQSFCADCHANLPDQAPDSTLRPASDFGDNHPDFRPTVVTDSALQIASRERAMSDTPPPVEDSSLDFPHDKHLRSGGVKHPDRGNVQLGCADCHEIEAGGSYMLPLSFDRHCHQCHALKFDTFLADRELLHGRPEDMFKQVTDVYGAVAMRGGYEEPEAPALIRRRPGTQLTPEEKKEALDWAGAKANTIINGRFGRGLCDGCHQLFESPASAGQTGAGWGVEPVTAVNRWFPKAKFSHGSHRDVECGTCHEARLSTASSDVIMPGIKTCQACHGGESAQDRVPSTCIFCHGFHDSDLPPMREPQKAAAHEEYWLRSTLMAFRSQP